MALTKVGSGGIENVTNAANATFLTIDASEQITVASEGGAVTTSVQQGLMKSWVNIDIDGTVSVNDSLNVGSITDGGAGIFNVVLSNNMNNNIYSSVGVVDGTGLTINCHTSQTDGRTTSQYRAYSFNGSGSATDYTCLLYQTAGDLA
jgi:hypothetical protein